MKKISTIFLFSGRALNTSKRKQRAFTLVELLVVIAIIAVLLSILVPTLNRARHSAKRVVCASNMKQISYAMRMYRDAWDNFWPIKNDDPCSEGFIVGKDRGSLTWMPYRTWSMVLTKLYLNGDSKVFICPSSTRTEPWDGKEGWDGGIGWCGNYAYNFFEYEFQKFDGGKWKQMPAASVVIVDGHEQSILSTMRKGYGYYGWPFRIPDPFHERYNKMTFGHYYGGFKFDEIPYERHLGRIAVFFADGHLGFHRREDFEFTVKAWPGYWAVTVATTGKEESVSIE
ncbi:MAG: type II secretion system protein [Planctomycetota bacterium]